MSEEVDDYMSDEILHSCLSRNEIERPGLIKSRKEQREHDILKKRNNAVKDKKKDEGADIKKLQEGLQEPIKENNKGFSMLQKMGFKSGMGLGKANTGIVEPVPINIKNDRQGLGRAEALKEIQLQKERIKTKRKERLTNIDDYRAMMSKKCKEREVISDLRKSKRVCHQLDVQSGVQKPEDDWFWPDDYVKKEESPEGRNEDEDEDEDDFEPSEKLEILTSYLRRTYGYCIWCSVQYSDEKDLQNCPGPMRELH